MKSVRILLLSSLMISSFPIIAHTHEELEAKVGLLAAENDVLRHEVAKVKAAFDHQKKHNEQLTQELRNSWSWVGKKSATLLVGVFIGWLVTAQGGQPGKSGIPGANTGRSTL